MITRYVLLQHTPLCVLVGFRRRGHKPMKQDGKGYGERDGECSPHLNGVQNRPQHCPRHCEDDLDHCSPTNKTSPHLFKVLQMGVSAVDAVVFAADAAWHSFSTYSAPRLRMVIFPCRLKTSKMAKSSFQSRSGSLELICSQVCSYPFFSTFNTLASPAERAMVPILPFQSAISSSFPATHAPIHHLV